MSYHRTNRTRASDGNLGNTVFNIFPMSKEKREELREVYPHMKGHGSTPEKRLANLKYKLSRRALVNRSESQSRFGPDKWHVLVEMGTRRKIKEAPMSRKECFARNKTIKDLGMEWTLGRM